MFNWFNSLDPSNKIEIISTISSLITSIVAIIISIKTLKQSNYAILETSRANIVFYIDILTGKQSYLVLKNFGNSSGKVLELQITPCIKASKIDSNHNMKNITDFSNITLAPNQTIKSWFNFFKYPDKIFNVNIKYETLGKTYIDSYTIDISYIDSIDYLSASPIDINTEKDALIRINNSILRLNERL